MPSLPLATVEPFEGGPQRAAIDVSCDEQVALSMPVILRTASMPSIGLLDMPLSPRARTGSSRLSRSSEACAGTFVATTPFDAIARGLNDLPRSRRTIPQPSQVYRPPVQRRVTLSRR